MPPSAADALTQLNAFQAPDSATVLTQARAKYGVDDLAKKVQDFRGLTGNLTNAIAAVDPSVTGRTAGSLVTEGQRSALVNRERAPVIGQLDTANNALKTAGEDYNTADSKSQNEANLTIADNKAKHDKLLETYQIANAREEAARQAAAEAAKFAEEQRQFNEQQATSRGSASYGGGGSGGKASAAVSKAAQGAAIAQNISKMAGSDGYVSRATFAAALRDFQVAGLGDIRKFWQIYGQYTNPKTRSQYANYAQR